MSGQPGSMRAYVLRGAGRAALEDVPIPEPGSGQVRLRVRACALNHLDLFAKQALEGPGIRPHHFPHVSGVDVSGVVDRLGPDVSGWEAGMPVVLYSGVGCGSCNSCRRGEVSMCRDYWIIGEQSWGGLAEYAVVPAANLYRLPPGFDLELAAAAPAAYTTAWRMLITAGGLRAGESALVVGAGGGVACAAIQIAALAGATVFATSGQDWKLDRALELGASQAVNHSQREFDGWVQEVTGGRGVDLVVDSVGAATWRRSIRSLAPGGRLCVCGATSGDQPEISIRELYQSHRRIIGAPMGGLADFAATMAMVTSGRIQPVIHAVYPLAEIEAAEAELESGRQFGKVVVVP